MNKTADVYITGVNGSGFFKDAILLKYNSSGSLKWVAVWKSNLGLEDFGLDVSVDQATGDVYMVGATWTGGGSFDMLLVKYDSSGNEQWNRTFGGDFRSEWGRGVVVDSSHNIYITGYNSSTNDDILIVKYDNLGNQIWNETFDGGYDDIAYDIAVDSMDNLYITGMIKYDTGDENAVLIKYTNSGVQKWNVTWGDDSYDQEAYGVAVDSQDNIYVTGGHRLNYMFLVKFTNTSNFKWDIIWDGGSTGNVYGKDVFIDSSDNISIAVSMTDPGNCLVLQGYNPSGGRIYEAYYKGGSSNFKFTRCIVVDGHNNYYLAGPMTNGPSNERDILLVKNPLLTNILSSGGGGDSGGNGDDNGDKEAISFGSYFLIFLIIAIISLTSVKKRHLNLKGS
jgi:hypothetical protein